MTRLKHYLTPRRRRGYYRVVVAAAPLAAAYGVVAEESLPLWLALAAAVLGVGVAERNVNDDEHQAD